MTRGQFFTTLVVMALFGAGGGLISGWLFQRWIGATTAEVTTYEKLTVNRLVVSRVNLVDKKGWDRAYLDQHGLRFLENTAARQGGSKKIRVVTTSYNRNGWMIQAKGGRAFCNGSSLRVVAKSEYSHLTSTSLTIKDKVGRLKLGGSTWLLLDNNGEVMVELSHDEKGGSLSLYGPQEARTALDTDSFHISRGGFFRISMKVMDKMSAFTIYGPKSGMGSRITNMVGLGTSIIKISASLKPPYDMAVALLQAVPKKAHMTLYGFDNYTAALQAGPKRSLLEIRGPGKKLFTVSESGIGGTK